MDHHPAPLVVFHLPSGNDIEIYDFGTRVAVMEVGNAGTPSTMRELHHLVQADRLVELATVLRPDLAAPPGLAELEQRIAELRGRNNVVVDLQQTQLSASASQGTKSGMAGGSAAPPTIPSGHGVTGEGGPPDVGGARLGGIQPDDACNNGCCDYTWLNDNLCNGSGYDYSWFQFDYGWGYANDGSVYYFEGAACAGTGTSTYVVSMGGGHGGTWSVPEGTYRTYDWLGGCGWPISCDDWVNSQVNSSTNEHLYSYCGGWIH